MNISPESKQPKRTAMASTKADLRELRGNSQATVQEIQEFLRELKGKSPQEMLGLVSNSGLFKSLLLATFLVAGGIFLFTLIPFLMAEKEPDIAAPAEALITERTPQPIESTEEPDIDAPPDPIDSLGVGEELVAPPEINPLENSGDDFLKDLE
ncbi:MAG: hypothetical protein AB8D78_03630 [Akkermansiaceae bacterium]